MKIILYILFFIGLTASAQVGSNRFVRFEEGVTPYPNQSNPNPELVIDDAHAFGEEEVNALNKSIQLSSNVTATAVTALGNGNIWNPLYARRVTADSDGTFRRQSIRFFGVTSGLNYDFDIMYRSVGGQFLRWRFSAGTNTDFNTTSDSTTWQLSSGTVTATTSYIQIDIFTTNGTANTGDAAEYVFSIKLAE